MRRPRPRRRNTLQVGSSHHYGLAPMTIAVLDGVGSAAANATTPSAWVAQGAGARGSVTTRAERE